jgi:outer membrane protein TolC
MKPRNYVALIALLFAGCAVGPDYLAPKARVPANWSEAQAGGTTNPAAPVVDR